MAVYSLIVLMCQSAHSLKQVLCTVCMWNKDWVILVAYNDWINVLSSVVDMWLTWSRSFSAASVDYVWRSVLSSCFWVSNGTTVCGMMRWDGQPEQSHLLAIVQAWSFSLRLFGHTHIAWMPDETDAKVLTASSLENWRRPPGRPHSTWMKTIQQDLKSNNLSLFEVINVAQNHPLRRLMPVFGNTHC